MLYDMVAFLEDHNVLLNLLSSFLMLMVTAIYAGITWWQAKNSKKTLLESVKQNKEERLPYVVPTIKKARTSRCGKTIEKAAKGDRSGW